MARTPLNEHCSAVFLKKLPEKLGDPGKFLIPCIFPGMAECLALADLGAIINLMLYSVWKRLSLFDLTPTCMTLELADHSITSPVGIAKNVYVKIGSFFFPADFVVVDFDADPRVPLILERSFLKTGKALIDVFEGELTLRVGKEAITFNLDQTSRYSANYNDMTTKRIDVIDVAYEPTSSEFYQPYLDPERDILLLEEFLNDDPSPPPYQGNYMPEVRKELKICEAHSEKSSVYEPHVAELKELPPHLEYEFLEGDDKLPVIIAKDLSVEEKTALITILKSHKRAIAWKLSDIKGINPEFYTHKNLMEEDFELAVQHQRREKTTFTCPYGTFAYRRMPFGLCNALGTFQMCMMAIFHDMIEKTMEVFMDDFSVFRNSFQKCVNAFRTLKTKLFEAPILIAPNWDMPFELMCDASDFAIGAVLGQRQDKHFRPTHYASKTMTEGAENLATDHLSRLENPHQNVLDPKEINEAFPLETLNMVSTRGSQSTPWFADFANYHTGNFIVKGMSSQQKNKFFKDVKHYLWDD
nr:reverse transcriptase domain-containing protein [Tanacetum cinerariifolium]